MPYRDLAVGRMLLFDLMWKLLSNAGFCDGFHSAEYRRVWQEWLAAGKPRRVGSFIRQRANLPPGGPLPH